MHKTPIVDLYLLNPGDLPPHNVHVPMKRGIETARALTISATGMDMASSLHSGIMPVVTKVSKHEFVHWSPFASKGEQ